MLARLLRICAETSGAALTEAAIVMPLFMVFTGGLVDFSLAFYQWNAASKAVQVGARLAAVSNPIDGALSSLTGLEGGAAAGDPFPPFATVCSGASSTCTGLGNSSYSASAMNTLVYGRGEAACGTSGPDQFPGMCDVFDRIRPQNVIVSYRHTGLGFAGRPGGPVPTITVELTGLTFNLVFLGGSITMPPMRTTVTGEDLSTSN